MALTPLPPSRPLMARHAPPPLSFSQIQVHEMQQALALIDCHALLALPEAAELLAEHMQLDLVG